MTGVDKRPIAPISIEGIAPGAPATKPPTEMWVAPAELLVDAAYQRDLSDRSLRLIRKIVAEWDWRRFKPPVVAMTDVGFECIDGQHTAIAAASHPAIERILVVVVDAAKQADRASAFIGHNRDRLTMTATQIHNAAVVAGDEDALTIEQVTTRAGVRVLRIPPSAGYQPGDTQAIASVASLIGKRGAMRARVVLELLAKASLAPVAANDIRAADHLMHSDEFGGWFTPEALTKTIADMRDTADKEAKVLSVTLCTTRWKALAAVWGRNAKRLKERIVPQAIEIRPVLASPERQNVVSGSTENIRDVDFEGGAQREENQPKAVEKQSAKVVPCVGGNHFTSPGNVRISDQQVGRENGHASPPARMPSASAVSIMGEPPPGRSALDQRRAEQAAGGGKR